MLLTMSVFVMPLVIHAATLSFDTNKNASIGQEVLVTVKIHTLRDKINTLSGTVIIDPKQADILRTYEGNSAITLWINHLTVSKTTRGTEITFSGITPGGFQGDFTLFSFVVKPLRAGNLAITTKDLSALKNDGLGSTVSLTANTQSMSIGSKVSTSTVGIIDTRPPEDFTLSLSRQANAFDGNYFVSFSAQDKGTGIDHYEVAYAFLFGPSADSWKPVQSPLVLPNGAGSETIYIRAVDMAGNQRIVSIAGPSHYATIFGWGILIVIFALCVRIFTKRRSSYSRR